ncbi:MAG: hypothetical protein RIQ81_822 [Pseudomonadota bacterium]
MDKTLNKSIDLTILALIAVVVSLLFPACHSTETISERPIDPVDATPVVHGPAMEPQKQDVYVKERRTSIKEAPVDPDGTGSLFPVDDPGANLFVRSPMRPGMFLDIEVITARGVKAEDKKQGGASKAEAAPADGLTASIPKLEPLEPGAAPLKSFKARLETILPGGDGVISVTRSSSRNGEFREFHAKALVPAEKMVPGGKLSTADLYDVAWTDYDGTQATERRSTSWEDEYSLRLSGFEELRSKEAIAVEEGRRQVELAREKLAEESRKMNDERTRSAKQRDELQQKLRETEAKVAELQKNVPAPAPAADGKTTDAKATDAKAADATKGGKTDDKKK